MVYAFNDEIRLFLGHSSPMKSLRVCAFVLVLALSLSGGTALSADKRTERPNVYDVPTTGKIMDVEYRPEFDEWWVKCREGDNIAVYSYDSRTQKWGRVQFVAKKPEEKAKTPESSLTDKTQQSGKADEAASEPQKKLPEKVEKKKETKWWDPLNVFKSGEKGVRQPEGGK